MNECEHLPAGIRRICEGQGGLTLDRVNQYRAKYGVPLLDALPEGAFVRPQVCPINSHRGQFETPVRSGPAFGPGTELKAILKKYDAPTCGDCAELAAKMNSWGVHVCREKLDEIVADIFPRAKEWVEAEKPWVKGWFGAGIQDWEIKRRIRKDVTAAIDEAERKQTEAVKKKSEASLGEAVK